MRFKRAHGGARLDEIERLYRNGYTRYVRVARAMVGEPELARDVVQDAFVSAVRQRAGWRSDGPVEAWLWQIVVNQARAAVRTRRPAEALGDETLAVTHDEHPDPQAVRRALSAIPERQRLALFLRYYADLDYHTIAETLDIEPGTVGASLHAARERLRSQLQEVEL